MSDNNTNVDTQNKETAYSSLEEAAFDVSSDSGSDLNDVFTTGEEGNTQESAPQGQPESTVESNEAPKTANNDETRYQYWQSEADKMKNENEQLKA